MVPRARFFYKMWGPAGGGKGDLPFFGSAPQGSWAWCQGTLGPHWRLGERSMCKWTVNRPCYREPGKARNTLTLTVRVPKPRPGVDEQWNMAHHQAGQRAAAVMVWGWREKASGGLGGGPQRFQTSAPLSHWTSSSVRTHNRRCQY